MSKSFTIEMETKKHARKFSVSTFIHGTQTILVDVANNMISDLIPVGLVPWFLGLIAPGYSIVAQTTYPNRQYP